MGEIAAKVDAAIVTNADAIKFFDDLGEFVDQLGSAADVVNAALNIAGRINIVAHSSNPAEDLFIQSVDMLADAGVSLGASVFSFASTTILTGGLAPVGILAGVVGGWAADQLYDHYGSKFIKKKALRRLLTNMFRVMVI